MKYITILPTDGHAFETLAFLRLRAVSRCFTFTSASLQRIADIVLLAFADRCIVWTHFAISVGTTSFADLIFGKSSTRLIRKEKESKTLYQKGLVSYILKMFLTSNDLKWIACISSWTSANGDVVLCSTISTLSTRRGTWVNTVVILTCLVVWALGVGDTCT